ncbi:MAG TPA: CRISPR-associated helicase Cas3' [Desulfobulbaceae bacterium]|nr:CRISPR-associated helicase Cas3' [Desulfobulbaceae bacterium]
MKPLHFSETLAHPGDLLVDHLVRVAREGSATLAGAPEPVRLLTIITGLCHDLGKATIFFQEWRLKQGRKEPLTNHSGLSALLFWWFSQGLCFEDKEVFWRLRLGGLIAILRHHGDLREKWLDALCRFRMGMQGNSVIVSQLSALDLDGLVRWLAKQLNHFDIPWQPFFDLPVRKKDILAAIQQPNLLKLKMIMPQGRLGSLADVTGFLAGFGALLAADKIDTALEGEKIQRVKLPPDMVVEYKRKEFGAFSHDPMTELRQKIARDVRASLVNQWHHHHFTLTAPTGSGKTLAILEAAFGLREKMSGLGRRPARIIYCLPFTSVIDQNHQVFRNVLKCSNLSDSQDILLKHHHLTDTFFRTSTDDEYEADGAGQLLTETWQSEIVVTTFYQFLHTFFSGKNRNLKRAAQLTGSIVILDEVQAVPLRYWQAIRHLLKSLAETLGTYFILMTATRPLIYGAGQDAVELLPGHEQYFAKLSRMRIENKSLVPTGIKNFTWQVVVSYSKQPRATLIIVNRRKTVKKLYYLLKKQFPLGLVWALSTNLTPLDRKKRIEDIQELLDKKQPVIVVSTQLVEAGVDISFPVVHRDLAPLDSVIQSSGRCNRHNECGHGVLYLWKLYDEEQGKEGAWQWKRIYDSCLIEATIESLGDEPVIPEEKFLELTKRYFAKCWERGAQVRVEEFLERGDFEKMAEQFHLIEDGPPTISVFVIQNEYDQNLWERYLALDDIESFRERRKEFMQFKFPFFERVIQVYGHIQQDDPIIAVKSKDGHYDREIGFIALPDENSSPCIF